MTIYKNVNGKRVAMTSVEATDFEASRAPVPKSTDPAKYTHTRRQFKTLITDAVEAEIKSVIQAATTAKLRREFRAFFEDESVFTWSDPTMVKLRVRMTPESVAAFEAAWIA